MLKLGAWQPDWMASEEHAKHRSSATRFAIATIFYWSALYVYVPTLPVYAASLGASLTVVGLVVSAYGFSQLVLRFPLGLASDRLGRRKPFCLAGLLFASLGCVVLLFAPDPTWLVIGRGVAGISAATWVTITVMFSDYFDSSHAPRAMALLTFLSGLAQLISTSVGGWLADLFGWSAPFLVGAGLGLIGMAILGTAGERRDIVVTPPTWPRILKAATNARLLQVALVGALLQFASWATTYAFVPIYAHDLGASATVLGLLTSSAQVLYTLAALGVVSWAKRWGPTRMVVIGLVLLALSTAAIPVIQSLGLLGLSQAIGGLGRGLAMSVLLGLSIQQVEPSEKATAMGVFQAVYALGMFVGPASAGFVAQALGLTAAFILCAVLYAISAAQMIWRRPGHSR